MPNKNNKIDFICALFGTIALFFISFLVPFLGFLSLIIVPIPLMLYRAKHNAVKGMLLFISAFLCIAVVLYFFAHSGEVTTFLLLAALGIFLGEAMEKGFSISKAALGGVALLVLPLFCLCLLLALQLGETPSSLLQRITLENIQEALQFYEARGLFGEAISVLQKNAEATAALITYISPALLTIVSLLVVLVNMIVGAMFLKRAGFPISLLEDFYFWKAPEGLVWVLIVAAFTSLFLIYQYVVAVAVNILLICLAIYALQGLAISFCFFKTRRVSVFIRLVFLLLLLFQYYLLAPIAFLGIFDLWFDFRKRLQSQK